MNLITSLTARIEDYRATNKHRRVPRLLHRILHLLTYNNYQQPPTGAKKNKKMSKYVVKSGSNGRQHTGNVVRVSDGKLVRSGLWPDAAEVECRLLNECRTAAEYFERRKQA